MEEAMQTATTNLKLNIQRTTTMILAVVFLLAVSVGAYSIEDAVPISDYLSELVPGDPDDMLYYKVTAAPIWRVDGLPDTVNSQNWVLDFDFSGDGVEYRDLSINSSLTGGYIDVSDIMAKADITLTFDVFMEMALRGDVNVNGQYQFLVNGYDDDGNLVETRVSQSGTIANDDFSIEWEEEYDDREGAYVQVQYLSLALEFDGTYTLPVNTEYINVLFYYNFDLDGANNGGEDMDGEWVDGWGEFKTTATPVQFSHALKHVKTDAEREEEITEKEDSLARKVKELVDKMNGIDKPDADELIPDPGTIVDTEMADQIGDCLKTAFTVGIVGEILTGYSILSLALIAVSFILFGRKA